MTRTRFFRARRRACRSLALHASFGGAVGIALLLGPASAQTVVVPSRDDLQQRLQPRGPEQDPPPAMLPAEPAAPPTAAPSDAAPPTPPPDTAEAAETTPPATLDIHAMLLAPDVFPQAVADPVWTLEQQSRRRLVQIPVDLHEVAEDLELKDSPIDLKGGRFIGFRIPAPGEAFGVEGDGQVAGGQNQVHLAPRLARAVTLTARGTLTWKLDRAIVGGTVRDPSGPEDNIFVLKLRPDVMRELQPGRLEIPQRQASEDAAAYRARITAAQTEQRAQAAAFGTLMRAIREAPDEFEEQAPPRVWAVYEMSDAIRGIELTGPEPLPWSTTVEGLKSLRAAAGATDSAQATGGQLYVAPTPRPAGGQNDSTLDPTLREAAGAFVRLAGSEGEINRRLAATWLVHSDATSQAAEGNPVYTLIEALVTGPDDAASRAAVAELISTTPSVTTAKLLVKAEPRLNVEQRMQTLRRMVEATADTAGTAAESAGGVVFDAKLEAVARQLHAPEGLDVSTLLDLATANLAGSDEQVEATAKALDVLSLPTRRRDEAMAKLVPLAGEDPLATRIVQTQLLAAGDAAVVLATLRGLTADPVTADDSDTATSEPDTADDPAVVASANETTRPPLPLSGGDAPVLKLLTAENEALREAAWSALPRFDLTPGSDDAAGGAAVDTPASNRSDIFDRLIQAGLATGRLDEAVATIRETGDEAKVMRSLIGLVLEGDARAAAAGVEALSGSGLPLEEAMGSMEEDARVRFIGRVYDPATGLAPPVVALRKDPQAPSDMDGWFARQLSTTGPPSPRGWAATYGDEATLLARAGSSDRQAANAAIAGLVASAGGDSEAAVAAAQSFAKLTDTSQPAIAAHWQQIKAELAQQRLAALRGTFILAAGVMPPAEGAATGDASVPVTPLARVELVVEGDGVRMAGDAVDLRVEHEPLRLIVPDPSQVAKLPGKALQGIDLSGVEAARLLPTEQGIWTGEATLTDGRRLRLELRGVR